MIDLLLRDSSDKLVVHKSGKKKTTTKLFKKMTLNSFAEREKEMKEKKLALPDATSLSAWHNAAAAAAAAAEEEENQSPDGGGGDPPAGRGWIVSLSEFLHRARSREKIQMYNASGSLHTQ